MVVSPYKDKDVEEPLSAGTEGDGRGLTEDLEWRRHTVGGETPPGNPSLSTASRTQQQVHRNPSDASAVSATSTIRRYSTGYFQVRRKPVAPRPVSPVSEGGIDGDGDRNDDEEAEVSIRDADRTSGVPFLHPSSAEAGRRGNSTARRSTSPAQIVRNYSYPGYPTPLMARGDALSASDPVAGHLSSMQNTHLPDGRQNSVKRGQLSGTRDGWRPSYLRRSVVLAFAAVFASLLVIIESLLSVDLARGSLGTGGGTGSVLLWSLVPPSVMIILANFWTRFDFQARRYYPWMLLSKKWPNPSPPRPASETLLLDYGNSTSIGALYTSIRNRHYLIAASTATSILLVASIVLSAGLLVKEGERLRMSPLVTHAIAALLAIMIALVLTTVTQVPREKIAPRNPNSIAGTALSLAGSPEVVASLKGTGASGIETASRRLSASLFTATIRQPRAGETGPRFVLQSVSSEHSATSSMFLEEGEEKRQAAGHYNPLVLRLVPRVVGIVCAAFFASLLWGLLSVSARKGNLVELPDQDLRYRAVLWTCLPALFLVFLSLYLSKVDMEIRTLTPFSELLAGPCPYSGAMTNTYTDELTAVTLYKAWNNRAWGVFTTATAALLASLTPILASSLFCIQSISQTTDNKRLKSATVTNKRLVQNPPQTYALASLLVAIVLLSCTSLIISPRKTSRTRQPPGTIAAVASLLSQGNLHTFFPPSAGVEWMADEEVARMFERKAFRVGWFARMEGEGGGHRDCFCISVVEHRK